MTDDTTGEALARKYLAENLSRGVRFALAAKMALNRASAEGADVLTMRTIEEVSGGTCYRRGTRIHIKRESKMLVTVQRWTPETARLTFDAARVVEVPFDVDENVRYFTINNDGSQSETEFWSMIEEGIEDGERVIDYDVSFSVTINDDGWEVTFHNGDDPLLGTWEEVVVFAVAALS